MLNLWLLICDILVNECRSAMLILRMDTSRLIVHAKNIEEQNLNQASRDLKKLKQKMGIHPRLSLRYKKNQCSKEVFKLRPF